MKRSWLLVLLMAVVCWTLAAGLEPWFQGWEGNRASSGNLLQIALGDGRKLFARHVYVKADAYFHNGYYPTIFDNEKGFEGAHINEAAGLSEGEEKAIDFLGAPRDWIDAFSRNFFPSAHRHLGEADCGHEHDHEGPCEHDHGHEGHEGHEDHEEEAEPPAGTQREILPWLRLSVQLDPQRVETYVVGAYWLRNELDKSKEAEAFLREGLRANPQDPQLLFELGRIFHEDHKDESRAYNVWELALLSLDRREVNTEEPNLFLRAQILGNLAKMEEKKGDNSRAIEHLQQLETFSPNAPYIRQWIEELRADSSSR